MSDRRPVLKSVAALVLGVALAACGTYSSHTDPIYRGVVGPAGGTVAAGPVTLVVVPGALATDVSVVILPQPDPLPIDPADGEVDPLDLHCIGPVGQGLLAPCLVRVCYDPALLPPGATLADLVLLEWDDANQWLFVRGTAVHDTALHCFEDVVYGALGHIGVGVRTARFDFAVPAVDPAIVGAGRLIPAGTAALVLASSTEALAPAVLANTEDVGSFVPSGDGQRILLEVVDAQAESSTLRAVSVPDGTVLWEPDPSLDVLTYDPLFGWFPGDPTNLYYAHEEGGDGFRHVFADADVEGAEHEHLRDGLFDRYLIDVRPSPDGTRALLRWQDAFEGFETCDVIATSTGALVGGDLPILPAGSATPMPRWLPDSSGLTFVDPFGGTTVQRIDPDGGNVGVLYTSTSTVLDAAVAPDWVATSPTTSRIALLRRTGLQVFAAGGSSTPTVFFEVDVIAGGALESQDLEGDFSVGEMEWHPDGGTVWCQLFAFSEVLVPAAVTPPANTSVFTVVFDAATAGTNRVLASPLGNLDIDKVSGRVLLWMPDAVTDPQFPQAGLWRLEADGTGGTAVSIAPWAASGPPRFLTSWRHGVCSAFNGFVR